jgi:hypothetical protein
MAGAFLNELVEDVNKELHLSNKLLSQVEGTGVDFYTINFLRMSMQEIHIGSQGQRLYNHCLTNLPLHRSGDLRLQFGWGEQHLMRNTGVQLFEYEHLLLASALGEYLSEPYAAAVLNELASRYEDDVRPKPRLASIRHFVKGANGILATSEFPIVVDERIRLNPYRLPGDGFPFAQQPQETLAADRIAEALCSLNGRRKDQSDLTIAGGDVLGWFSAYADLCLGLDVTLTDEDGKELHRANASADGWRLVLRFIQLGTVPNSSHICLRVDKPILPRSMHTVHHSGRVMPFAAFNQVFGPAFHRLSRDESKTFANALGGTARGFELLAVKEDVSTDFISPDNKRNTASWGLGLIQTWTNWFPELRHLQGRMERAQKLGAAEASQQCEDCILRLEPLCGCYICSPTVGSDDNPSNLPQDGFCIPTVMETIIMLGLALSRVALTPNLYPSRAGMLAMYKSQMRKRLDLKKAETSRYNFKRHMILFGEDWNSTFPKRILNALAMFSGSWPPLAGHPENMIGMSHEGVCAYSMMLERGTKRGRHPDDQVIRVVTGSVNWRQKTLQRICIGPIEGVEVIDAWEKLKCEHIQEDLYVQ